MKLPIQIAVVGAGTIGLAHINAIVNTPGIQLNAIVDTAENVADLEVKFGVPVLKSLEELFRLKPPNGVVLATPNQLHVEQALFCLEKNVSILLEKPIATSVREGEKIVLASRTSAGRVLIGHHRAHSPIMMEAKKVIDSGELGRLVALMGSATFMKPDIYFEQAPWRKKMGAGPILINMIHEVHNMRMLCGNINSVQAISSNVIRNFEVEDTVAINLEFGNGVLGSFMLSDTAACARSWEQTSKEDSVYPSSSDEDCYVLTGTHGTLNIPTMRIKSYVNPQERSWWTPFSEKAIDFSRADPLALQMLHFSEVIRENVEPLVTAQDGLENLKVTEAIRQAAQTGMRVKIDS